MRAGAGDHAGAAVVVDLHRAVLDVQADGRGDLDVGRQTDAELLGVALLAPLRLLLAQILVARRLQHGIERLLVLAAVVIAARGGRERELVGLEEVHAPDLRGVHPDLGGGHVEHALDELRGLRPPGAAIRADGGVVRQHAHGLEAHLRDVVHAHRHHLREHRQDGAQARIRAGGGDGRTVEADDLALLVDAQPHRHHEVATVHERDHVF